MASAVVQTVPLGLHWPTVDPFLFCAHHRDHYPAGNDCQGVSASLAGRRLGQDFELRDGFRMYHGRTVPGFPAHPHRGFETVTYVREGLIDHADSLGASARFGRGDVQWMTAGSGILHSEMFPLLDRDGPNPVELFQIWVNLPAASKMIEPHFSMLWNENVPRLAVAGSNGQQVTVRVIAGRLGDAIAPPPPPASYVSHDDADVAIWHIVFDAGATWTLPPAASEETVRTLYVFSGSGLQIDGEAIAASTGVVVDATRSLELVASATVEILMLQGRPIGEPIARNGPFVMNTDAQIREAFDDYQRTHFGVWPWGSDDPVHGIDNTRFARHADGRIEHGGTT